MTQKDRVLAMLEQGPKTTGDFLNVRIPRFSARIEELREAGYRIASERVREGSWRYELVPSEPMALILDYTGPEPVHGFRPLREVLGDFKADLRKKAEIAGS